MVNSLAQLVNHHLLAECHWEIGFVRGWDSFSLNKTVNDFFYNGHVTKKKKNYET